MVASYSKKTKLHDLLQICQSGIGHWNKDCQCITCSWAKQERKRLSSPDGPRAGALDFSGVPSVFIPENSQSKRNPRQTHFHASMPTACVGKKGKICVDLSQTNQLSAALHLEIKYKLLASKIVPVPVISVLLVPGHPLQHGPNVFLHNDNDPAARQAWYPKSSAIGNCSAPSFCARWSQMKLTGMNRWEWVIALSVCWNANISTVTH